MARVVICRQEFRLSLESIGHVGQVVGRTFVALVKPARPFPIVYSLVELVAFLVPLCQWHP